MGIGFIITGPPLLGGDSLSFRRDLAHCWYDRARGEIRLAWTPDSQVVIMSSDGKPVMGYDFSRSVALGEDGAVRGNPADADLDELWARHGRPPEN